MKRRRSHNPKRQIRLASDPRAMSPWPGSPRYTGNPEHKRNPGDFGLMPPSMPRIGKSLCDDAGAFTHASAAALLRLAFERGLVSVQEREGWPQNVWAVTLGGVPLEAQHEGSGAYHGYPMPAVDPLRDEVLARWLELRS